MKPARVCQGPSSNPTRRKSACGPVKGKKGNGKKGNQRIAYWMNKRINNECEYFI